MPVVGSVLLAFALLSTLTSPYRALSSLFHLPHCLIPSLCAVPSDPKHDDDRFLALHSITFRTAVSLTISTVVHIFALGQKVLLYMSNWNPHPAYHLMKGTDRVGRNSVFCHASARHQTTFHQDVLIFVPLLRLQKLLSVALVRCSSSR